MFNKTSNKEFYSKARNFKYEYWHKDLKRNLAYRELLVNIARMKNKKGALSWYNTNKLKKMLDQKDHLESLGCK